MKEFDNHILHRGVTKPKEQTITNYLGGLKRNIHEMVQLQFYITINNVKFNIKVECQLS